MKFAKQGAVVVVADVQKEGAESTRVLLEQSKLHILSFANGVTRSVFIRYVYIPLLEVKAILFLQSQTVGGVKVCGKFSLCDASAVKG